MIVDALSPECSGTTDYHLPWRAPAPSTAARIDLATRERRYSSQGGETGVLEAMFEVISPGRKFAVEFGAMDGLRDSITRHFIVDEEESALLIEGSPDRAEAAETPAQLYRLPQFGVKCGGRATNGRGRPAFDHYSIRWGLWKPFERPLDWGSQRVPKRWVER